MSVRKVVSKFWIDQITPSFPDGAPQREDYDDDEAHARACYVYEVEWRRMYACADMHCSNRECPEHSWKKLKNKKIDNDDEEDELVEEGI